VASVGDMGLPDSRRASAGVGGEADAFGGCGVWCCGGGAGVLQRGVLMSGDVHGGVYVVGQRSEWRRGAAQPPLQRVPVPGIWIPCIV
jgi:hypothetical protein